jgi:wobble nucleotide-excising tRNase
MDTVIKRITKLRNFGIFKDCAGSKAAPFGQYNLIYGWNGSGKSTLSGLFACIEKRCTSVRFPSSEFSIDLDGGGVITEKTIAASTLNIRTFNLDFVKENIDWDNRVKGILLVDKKKIDDKAKLDDLKIKQNTDDAALKGSLTDAEKARTERDTFLSRGAKNLKSSLQSIDTSDSYYLNYDKRKFENFITTHSEQVIDVAAVLDDDEILRITKAAKPTKMDAVVVPVVKCNGQDFLDAYTELSRLLASSAVNQVMQRLEDHSDIRDWVDDGLRIHKEHSSTSCEFCGNQLTAARLQQLESHFSKAYTDLQKKLEDAKASLPSRMVVMGAWPSEAFLYEEFRGEYVEALKVANLAVDELNNHVTSWAEALDEKVRNPGDTTTTAGVIPPAVVHEAHSRIAVAAGVLLRHNEKTENFEGEIKKNKTHLEKNLVARALQEYAYFDSADIAKNLQGKIDTLKKEIEERRVSIQAIEDSLSNEGIGASNFNESLHRFLGRSELSLVFSKNVGGYEIIRNGVPKHDGNLSEGEKTAIAFVYFITKLSENDNRIESTVVVVDDPVSSFDSNHLFHAYSFLRNRCDAAMQLFVLTHNFTYFKLVRDWMSGRNKNRTRKGKDPVSFFYTIESTNDLPRSSSLADASQSLTDYNSEYHYIYQKLAMFKAKDELNRDEAFLAANLARKLLETFFSFKYPRHRADIAQLLECGQKGCVKTTEETREKVYRFINKYSHSVVIDINDDAAENMMGEGKSVVRDIFVWIEEVDAIHYQEMEAAIQAAP